MAQYNRGEVWIVDLGYAGKRRPCVILSVPASDQERALITVVAHTTSLRGTDFEVDVRSNFLERGAFDAQNISSVAHSKLVRKLGILTPVQLAEVEKAVCWWLGF
jgi:mRNA interferase MazF